MQTARSQQPEAGSVTPKAESQKQKAVSIIVQDLGKRFNREWIFRKLSYEFIPGNTYAITGPNGSGKSTLLHVLWGQMPQSTGTLQYRVDDKILPLEEIYRHLSIATPYMDLIEEFTLEEQIRFHFNVKTSRNNLQVSDMIERMYMTPARHKLIGNFSSGMRQRVKLALAFFTEADVVFLDEPGTNLDHEAFEWYQQELKALPQQCIVFIASNQPTEYPVNAHKIDIRQYK